MNSKEARQQIILFIDGPTARKNENLPQPEHGFEAGNCSSRRVQGWEITDLRRALLHPEVVPLDALLEMIGNTMNRIRVQEYIID